MAPEQGPDSKTQSEKKETVANEEESAQNYNSSKNNSSTASQTPDMDSVGWIYLLRKEQLIEQCKNARLPTAGLTVENLRKRLAENLRARRLSASTENILLELEKEIKSAERSVVLEDEISLQIKQSQSIEIMNIIHRWDLKFSGCSDLLEFLERMEELAECLDISPDRLLPLMISILSDNALKWYRIKKEIINTWQCFRREMEKFFLPSRYLSDLEKTFLNRKQIIRERAKDYILNKLSISRRHPVLCKLNHLDQIYDGLRTEYRYYIRRTDFDTLDELIVLTEEYENLKQEESHQTCHMISSIVYRRMERCWRCKGLGHNRTKCTLPPRLFCSYCGRDGVLSRQCLCHKQPDAAIRTHTSSSDRTVRTYGRQSKCSTSKTTFPTPLHMLKADDINNKIPKNTQLHSFENHPFTVHKPEDSKNIISRTPKYCEKYLNTINEPPNPQIVPLFKRDNKYTRSTQMSQFNRHVTYERAQHSSARNLHCISAIRKGERIRDHLPNFIGNFGLRRRGEM